MSTLFLSSPLPIRSWELPLQNPFPARFWVRAGTEKHKKDLEGRRKGRLIGPEAAAADTDAQWLPRELGGATCCGAASDALEQLP